MSVTQDAQLILSLLTGQASEEVDTDVAELSTKESARIPAPGGRQGCLLWVLPQPLSPTSASAFKIESSDVLTVTQ